jgi:hypothetical protein
MTTDEVFDLLDHAVEPEPWQCDDPWEYRAMHWRPSEAAGAQTPVRSLAASLPA